jgi:hypothetical protein
VQGKSLSPLARFTGGKSRIVSLRFGPPEIEADSGRVLNAWSNNELEGVKNICSTGCGIFLMEFFRKM